MPAQDQTPGPDTFRLDRRSLGVLLHPTSLPGELGSGDLGGGARAFVDFLARSGARFWQVLPLGQTGHGHSPYALSSVFAGGEHLVAIDRLVKDGLLDPSEIPRLPEGRTANLTLAFSTRHELLRKAFLKAQATGYEKDARRAFADEHRGWLEPYCLFAALKRAQGGAPFWEWPERFARGKVRDLGEAVDQLADEIAFVAFVQYAFHRDLSELVAYAHARGVGLVGDLPIFVAHDSADVWQWPELFQTDARGDLSHVAGVPPDAFSDDGQLWGNPLYDWDALERGGFGFWIERVRHAQRYFDVVRMDHFIGFVRYWAVPREATTAKEGAYHDGPKDKLFAALRGALGNVEIIAEDLGVVTPEVTALRKRIGAPGMQVLQFAMSPDDGADGSRMHHTEEDAVVYTGTHDNDTLVGWLSGPAPGASNEAQYIRERAFALQYAGQEPTVSNEAAARALCRVALMSRARTAVLPIQDLLGLGRDARMNRPGMADGNWSFRLRTDELGDREVERLRELASTYGRLAPSRA